LAAPPVDGPQPPTTASAIAAKHETLNPKLETKLKHEGKKRNLVSFIRSSDLFRISNFEFRNSSNVDRVRRGRDLDRRGDDDPTKCADAWLALRG
jgi:hypothetical protein